MQLQPQQAALLMYIMHELAWLEETVASLEDDVNDLKMHHDKFVEPERDFDTRVNWHQVDFEDMWQSSQKE